MKYSLGTKETWVIVMIGELLMKCSKKKKVIMVW